MRIEEDIDHEKIDADRLEEENNKLREENKKLTEQLNNAKDMAEKRERCNQNQREQFENDLRNE